MDCGLLQAMAEEDEEINVYNEETFGMGVCLKKIHTFLFLLCAYRIMLTGHRNWFISNSTGCNHLNRWPFTLRLLMMLNTLVTCSMGFIKITFFPLNEQADIFNKPSHIVPNNSRNSHPQLNFDRNVLLEMHPYVTLF